MIALIWLKGLIGHRFGRMLVTAAGIALGTALLALLGLFATGSAQTMTRRAIAAVPADWQIVLAPGTSETDAMKAIRAAGPVRAALPVGYADVTAFEASTGGTTQTTGAGVVVGLPPDYARAFPGQLRLLAGTLDGVLIAQQTAANLHAGIGDAITARKPDGGAETLVVAGIVDLPNADAMFQAVGAARGTTPTAPPDNVVLLPMEAWDAMFTEANAAGARKQIHVSLDHAALPADPAKAYLEVLARARNVEARSAGALQIGDNLGTRLDAVREDALFAHVLLLFLGAPGIALGIFLTIATARASEDRHRREQALLQLRGARPRQVLHVLSLESGLIAALAMIGCAFIAAVSSRWLLGSDVSMPQMVAWIGIGATAALLLTLITVLTPTLWALGRRPGRQNFWGAIRGDRPLWERSGLDLALLIFSALVFWRSARSGYQVILAPEGVPATSVDYLAFLAPVFFWAGACLLVIRLTRLGLTRGRGGVQRGLSLISGHIAPVIASSLAREKVRVSRSAALAALAIAFATATAIFNATYNAQLNVDAALTNGAEVTVTGTSSSPAGTVFRRIAGTPGVAAAEPMQHRYAYVGNDLQDLYGIDPERIGKATEIVDAYFANRDARGTLAKLAANPDGILVSQETVNDYQLAIGDPINIRLQDARDHQYHIIPFRFVGVVNEFPTAPRDSFLVANRAYVAAVTGNHAAEVVLVRTEGDPAGTARALRGSLGPTSPLKVSDVTEAARLIGSSLTAVDLHNLTTIEMAFAVLFAVSATGLVLALGFAERMRTAAILIGLGARRSDVAGVLWSEAAVVVCVGVVSGSLIGIVSAEMLIKLLTGVFDPPPDALSVPWAYLATILVTTVLASAAAVLSASWSASARVLEQLRSA